MVPIAEGILLWLTAPPALLLPVLGGTRVPLCWLAHLGLSSQESLVAGGKGRGFGAAGGHCEPRG